MVDEGHQNFVEIKFSGSFGEGNEEENLSVEMCSVNFFLEHALIASVYR